MVPRQGLKCFLWSLLFVSLLVLWQTFEETQKFVVTTSKAKLAPIWKLSLSPQSPPVDDSKASLPVEVDGPKIWVQLTFSLDFERELMPHTLKYYIDTLSVDPAHVLVALHHQNQNQTNAFDTAEEWLRQEYGIQHVLQWTGNYTSNRLWKRRDELRSLVNISACDWILRSDSDEFPAIPGDDLPSFLKFVSLQGYDSVFGSFNDRVAMDGSLPNITSDEPLHQQFPLSCHVTDRIVQANMQKAVAFRAYHQENRGGHYLLKMTNHSYEAREGSGKDHCGYPSKLRIDHYKWTYPVIEKLRQREEHYREKQLHYTQSLRFLDYIDEHDGKFNVKGLNCTDTNSVSSSFKMNYTDFYSTGVRCGRPKVECPA